MNLNSIFRTVVSCSILFTASASAQLTLHLDRDFGTNPWTGEGFPIIPVLGIKGNVSYDSFSHIMTIQSDYPVICNRSFSEYTAASNVFLRLLDPNGENHADDAGLPNGTHYLGLNADISYDFVGRKMNIKSEDRLKSVCLSSYDFDVIYQDSFSEEPIVPNDVYYNFVAPPLTGYAPGDSVSYELFYVNNSNQIQTVDLKEYYSKSTGSNAYFSSTQGLLCRILDQNDDVVRSCSYIFETASVNDEQLNPGEKIKLTLERVVAASSVVGEEIEMMAAVFFKGLSLDAPSAAGNIPVFTDFNVESYKLKIVAPN